MSRRRAILEFHAAGGELFTLQFRPVDIEMRRLAENVIPRVRGGLWAQAA